MSAGDNLSVPFDTNWMSISDFFENAIDVETDSSCLGSSSNLTEGTHSSSIGEIQSTSTIFKPSEFEHEFNSHQSGVFLTIEEESDKFQNIGDHMKISRKDYLYSSNQEFSQQNAPLSKFDDQTEKHSSLLRSHLGHSDTLEAGKMITI